MKSLFSLPALLVLFATLTVCAFSQGVVRDYDREFDFSTLQTYAWLEQDKPPIFRAIPSEAEGDSDEKTDGDIKRRVDERLQKKKFRKVPADQADFLISYMLVGRLETETQSFDSNPVGSIPYGHWRPFYEAGQDSILLRTGTLSIDIVNPADNQLIWRGSATDTVEKTKDAPKKIRKAIDNVLKKFPPK